MKLSGLVLLVAAVLVVPLGCDGDGDTPSLGQVTGTVTMDGSPLKGARVIFTPEVEGTVSSGGTDANGRYELLYGPRGESKGAVVGRHTVRIETVPSPGQEESFVRVPAKYNEKSELSADVKAGENTFNFDLQSK